MLERLRLAGLEDAPSFFVASDRDEIDDGGAGYGQHPTDNRPDFVQRSDAATRRRKR